MKWKREKKGMEIQNNEIKGRRNKTGGRE